MSHVSKLKTHRKRSGFSQRDLACMLGLKQPAAISRHESGMRIPDLKTAFAYQALFNCDLGELFPGLQEQVRAEVATRAVELSQSIMRRGHDRKLPYKLQKLARLEVLHAATV